MGKDASCLFRRRKTMADPMVTLTWRRLLCEEALKFSPCSSSVTTRVNTKVKGVGESHLMNDYNYQLYLSNYLPMGSLCGHLSPEALGQKSENCCWRYNYNYHPSVYITSDQIFIWENASPWLYNSIHPTKINAPSALQDLFLMNQYLFTAGNSVQR